MSAQPVTSPGSCMFTFNRKVLLLACIIGVSACGLIDPKFEDYETEGGGTGSNSIVDPSTECGQAALAAFNSNLAQPIASVCAMAGCHSSGAGAAKLLLVGGESIANRTNLFGFTGFDRGKLTAFIGSAAHGGGDKSADLPVEKVTAWLDVEEQCATQQAGLTDPHGHSKGR